MSEYEFDKNRTASGANANPDGSNDPNQALSPASSAGTPGEWAEQDEWSLRSSSVDEDDPLLKLARLMQENERNFEAAAANSPTEAAPAAAPQAPAAPSNSEPLHQAPAGQAPVPPGSAATPAAPVYAYDDESDWDAPAPGYQEPPVSQAPPSAPADVSYPTVANPEAAPIPAASLKDDAVLAEQAREAVAVQRPVERAQLQTAQTANVQTPEAEIDPFVPPKARNAPLSTDYDDFDVSRMPRAIRPPENGSDDSFGGLHGQATEDLIAAANQLRQNQASTAAPTPAAVQAAPEIGTPAPPVSATVAPPGDPAPVEAASIANPVAAETVRPTGPVLDPVAAAPTVSVSSPSVGVDQPVAAAETPQQQDFSYLREVEDLRVPPKDGDPASARQQTFDDENAETSADSEPPSADAEILTQQDDYSDYGEHEGGLFANRGMLVATGVLAFVILGAVGLMTYQALVGDTTDGPAPLVLADKSDVRITPDGQATDDSGLGPLTESGSPQDGQLVSRAEQPLNLSPNIDQNRSVRIIPSGSNNNAQNDGGLGPRPVQTFTVRPDGSIVNNSGASTNTQTSTVQPRAVTTQPITTNDNGATVVSTGNSPTALPRPRPGGSSTSQNSTSLRTVSTVQPQTVQPQTVQSQAGQTQTETGRAALPDAPTVSVAPRTQSGPTFDPAAPSVQPSTTVAAAPTVTLPEPAPASTAPTTSAAQSTASGDFVVQISSQRSEGAASSTFADLQSRFPSILGGQSPDIVRADLGARGVFYRVRVGPMQSRDEASQFCQRLQAAGGDCIVARR